MGKGKQEILKDKVKTRRGYGRKNKKITKKFKIWGSNANGILSKQESFNNFLDTEKPCCFFLQETKCTRVGQFKVDGYQIFETVRKELILSLKKLEKLSSKKRIEQRRDKFIKMGNYKG